MIPSVYLEDRLLVIKVGIFLSFSAPIAYGVPQGPILGPIWFSLFPCLVPFISLRWLLITMLMTSRFTCLWNPVTITSTPKKVKLWVDTLNFLWLNNDKTDVILLGPFPMPTGRLAALLGPRQPSLHIKK